MLPAQLEQPLEGQQAARALQTKSCSPGFGRGPAGIPPGTWAGPGAAGSQPAVPAVPHSCALSRGELGHLRAGAPWLLLLPAGAQPTLICPLLALAALPLQSSAPREATQAGSGVEVP